MLSYLPMSLVMLRFLFAPLLIVMYLFNVPPIAYGGVLIAGLLSDVFDGMIARRLDVVTPLLRSLDSLADTAFYIAVAAVVYMKYPAIIMDYRWGLIVLLGLELIRYIYDGVKFSKSASYHMWSAKLWGVFLFLGFFEVLVLEQVGILFECALCIGMLTNLEGLLVSLILKHWQCDVPSVLHAYLQNMQRSVSEW